MEKEATTAELAEIFSVSRKTISVWAKRGLMEKSSHGRYKLEGVPEKFCAILHRRPRGRRSHPLGVREVREQALRNDRGLPIDHDWEGFVPGPFAGKTPEELEAMGVKLELVDLPVLPLEQFKLVYNPDGTVKRARLIGPAKPPSKSAP